MKSRLLWAGGAAIAAVVLGIWIRPYALSAYHLEAGGSDMDSALAPIYPDWLAPEQIVDAEQLETAMTHLEASVRWDPRNVQAMRMMARGYLSLGQPEAALQVLEQALAVRPRNPLIHLELGDVYDSLGNTEEARLAYELGGIGSRGLPLAVNYLKLAEAQVRWGSGEMAIGLWRQVLELDDDNLYALYRLADIHRGLGDETVTAEYVGRLQSLEPTSVTIPLEPRLAEYQGQAMIALVDEGIWAWDRLLDVVSWQAAQAADGLPAAMAERVLQTLLARWPENPDLEYYLELSRRVGMLEIVATQSSERGEARGAGLS